MYRKTSLLILAAATLIACTVGRVWSTYDSNEESTSYDGDGASGQRGFSFR